MNNGIFRSGHLQNAITVDPNSLERVEIIYGSSSVGYGSDALGGVVHYYTKTPKINNAQKLTNSFSSTFNSARQSFVYHLNSEASFNKSAIITSFTFSKFQFWPSRPVQVRLDFFCQLEYACLRPPHQIRLDSILCLQHLYLEL